MYKRFSLVIMFALAALQAPSLAQNSSNNSAVGQILEAAKGYGDYKKDERRRDRFDERRHKQRHDRRHPHRDRHDNYPRDRRR